MSKRGKSTLCLYDFIVARHACISTVHLIEVTQNKEGNHESCFVSLIELSRHKDGNHESFSTYLIEPSWYNDGNHESSCA